MIDTEIIYYILPNCNNVYWIYKPNLARMREVFPNAIILNEEQKKYYLKNKGRVSVNDLLKLMEDMDAVNVE